MTNIFHVILYYFSILSVAVSACVPTDTKYVNHTARIINVEPRTTILKHSLGGSVKIIDGCSFSVRNMTLIPTGDATYWWGIPVSNETEESYPRVVAAALGSYNGQNVVFHLDPQYSFDKMAILEIRSEGDNRPYGAWSISKDVVQYYGVDDSTVEPLDFYNSSSSHLKTESISSFLLIMLASMVLII